MYLKCLKGKLSLSAHRGWEGRVRLWHRPLVGGLKRHVVLYLLLDGRLHRGQEPEIRQESTANRLLSEHGCASPGGHRDALCPHGQCTCQLPAVVRRSELMHTG